LKTFDPKGMVKVCPSIYEVPSNIVVHNLGMLLFNARKNFLLSVD